MRNFTFRAPMDPRLRKSHNYALMEEDRRGRRGARLSTINEEPRKNDEDFPRRVVSAAISDLFIPLPNRSRTRIRNCEINLATLQRMNIHAIQRDLVRLTSHIIDTGRMEVDGVDSQAVRVRELMKEYCKYLYLFITLSSLQCRVELNT